ncbi:hypothetical protein JCM21900_002575 [Sporobolomyces salmonicolor]
MFRTPRLVVLSLLAGALILLPAFIVLRSSFDSPSVHNALWAPGSIGRGGAAGARAWLLNETGAATQVGAIDALVKHGGVIMPKLGNATAKAELGRASWKLLHTMAARFPEQPTDSEREAFKDFLYLFSRLYPCGECAAEFQALLRKHPPQTSSRTAASFHLCHLHNLVNTRLGKPEFDCSADLDGVYDCGCGPDEDVGDKGKTGTADVGREEARLVELEEGDTKTKEDEALAVVDDGTRRDPQTGLELVGG